ncbi:hypothetical protein SLH49_09810 [Cognatiyoonia sp. IB215446]|uniref:hypothetical protein n=1 Tax=Cognatiyoonia sp. IB215446 TaxID=3097355 RepID=UPI002A14B417|nr:hypothetical protein [Cognatiyoonia sp. IB215446]MDX8348283.1 hypothetical protein [Cognatiyoonia sp. IB215446]
MKNMDDSPKILAVSYGNFSCRLEGFDDSVETMKAVVSYFHELAGHERFMDMDPQAPDMDTLARLTEEQVGEPVEVTGEGNSVSLRVADAEADADDDAAEEIDMADVEDLDLADDDLEDDFDAPLEAEGDAEETLDDVHDTIVLRSDDEIEENDVDAVDVDDVAEDAEDAFDEDDSVAARLQRIRAVVDNGNPAESGQEEPEQPAAPAAGVNPLAQRLADLAKRNAERAAEEAGVELHLDEDEEDAVSAEELAELDAEFAEEEDDVAAEAEDLVAESDEDLDEGVDDDVLQLAPEDLAEDAAPADETDGPLVLTASEEVPSRGGDYGGDFNLKEEVAEAQREIEEILEEKDERSKHDNVLDNVDKSMTRIMSQTDEHLNEPEGRRHRDAFAQLKAAVAATEAARQLGDAGAQARDKNEVFREDLGALDAEDAEDKVVEDEETLETPVEEVASDDVADEPTDAEDAPEESAAPAPLKLVSSQIVEQPSTTLDAASARLRQIAAQKDAGGAPKGGFAEFAAQQGATELGDLLEAAAAYIAFVEGDEDFSRPQVMKKVQAASPNEFTREDGLRSFGRLLRQSRIIKLNNGRFQVAEDTRFRPGDQAAQG